MRFLVLVVLVYSTAVSSTSIDDSDVSDCDLGSPNLCNNLSNRDELDLNDVETPSKAVDFSSDLQTSLYSEEQPQLPQCLLCKTAFRAVKKLISKRASNDVVKRAMNRACNKLGKVSNMCHKFVAKHGDGVIRFVRNPKVICLMLGMCSPIGDETTQNEIIDLMNEEQIQTEYDMLEQEYAHFAIGEVFKKGGAKCNICKVTIRTVLKMVHHGGKDEIRNALGQVCQKIGKMRSQCEEMVNKHSDQIVDLVTKHTPPKLICKAIGMCKSALEDDFEIDETQLLEQNNELTIDVEISSSPKCFLCKQLIKALKQLIQHKSDKGSIQRAMQKVCSKLGKLRGKCDRFVQRHGNSIVELLSKRTPVNRVCKALGVCKKSNALEDFEMETTSNEELEPLPDFKSTDSVCEFWKQFIKENDQLEGPNQSVNGALSAICEFVLNQLKSVLTTQEQRDRILSMILVACEFLPSFLTVTCNAFIKGYGSAVLFMISSIQADTVCNALHTSGNQTILEEFNREISEYLDKTCGLSVF